MKLLLFTLGLILLCEVARLDVAALRRAPAPEARLTLAVYLVAFERRMGDEL